MKLQFKTKLSYGIGGIADNAMFTLAGTFLLFYLTSVAGLAPGIAGIIVAIGSIWEVICGPIIGSMSDNLESKYGKRKPFLIIGAFPVAISMSLLFRVIAAPPIVRNAYYLVMTLLFWMSFSSFFVPYMAWGSDLTDDYNERTVLRSYAYVFNQVGMSLGMVAPSIVIDKLMSIGVTRETSWSILGMSVGLVCAISLWICAFTIKVSDRPDFVKPQDAKRLREFISLRGLVSMLKGYAEIIKVRPVMIVVLASLSFLIANTIYSASRVYYYTYNVGYSAATVSMLMAVVTFGGIILTPFIAGACNRIDKKYVFIAGMALAGTGIVITRFTVVETVMEATVQCVIFTLGNTCYWQLMPSLLYDVCEAEELASGAKHSGQVISLQALSESLSTAVGSAVLGLILQCVGFDEQAAVQSHLTGVWINNCFALLPGIVMIITAVILLRYPIDSARFKAIKDALERRSNGEPVDMEEFRDVY